MLWRQAPRRATKSPRLIRIEPMKSLKMMSEAMIRMFFMCVIITGVRVNVKKKKGKLRILV
jgi:hypothetical protein